MRLHNGNTVMDICVMETICLNAKNPLLLQTDEASNVTYPISHQVSQSLTRNHRTVLHKLDLFCSYVTCVQKMSDT